MLTTNPSIYWPRAMHYNVHLDVPSIFDTNFGGVCELLHQLHLSGYRATDICLAV
jgi:hypothetical protein